METHRPVVALVGVPAFHRGRPGLQAAVQTQPGLWPRGEPTRPRGEPTRPWDGSTQQDHRRRRSLSQAQIGVCSLTSRERILQGSNLAPRLCRGITRRLRMQPNRRWLGTSEDAGRNSETRAETRSAPRTAAVSRRGRHGGAVGCSQPCAHAGATEVAPAKLPSGKRHCAVGTATETNAGRKGGGATPTFLSG